MGTNKNVRIATSEPGEQKGKGVPSRGGSSIPLGRAKNGFDCRGIRL